MVFALSDFLVSVGGETLREGGIVVVVVVLRFFITRDRSDSKD